MILAAFLLQAAATAAPAPAPPWLVTTSVRNGNTATSSSAWSQDGATRLVVRCDTSGAPIVSIQFIPKAGFAAAQPRPVSINVDDGGWLGTNWHFPGNGAFVSDDVVVTNLTAMIAHGKTIRVRAIGPDDSVVEATFVGPGETPIRRVLAACGYAFGLAPQRAAVVAPAAAPKPDADDDQ
jgi:hypothetical protein